MFLAPLISAFSSVLISSSPHSLISVKNGKPISPFHDIPLWVDKEKSIANFVCEIPQGTQPKLEIATYAPFAFWENIYDSGEPLNPIKQDTKNGKLRDVAYPYPFNYGAFPQTWEDPTHKDESTEAFGDNDPIDVCELSGVPRKTGDVIPVKVLGTIAMIDDGSSPPLSSRFPLFSDTQGETDWKIIAIAMDSPLAAAWDSHEDIPSEHKEKVRARPSAVYIDGFQVFTFLRDYKIPDGKPPNTFAFDGAYQSKVQLFSLLLSSAN